MSSGANGWLESLWGAASCRLHMEVDDRVNSYYNFHSDMRKHVSELYQRLEHERGESAFMIRDHTESDSTAISHYLMHMYSTSCVHKMPSIV